jgi:hypothetical protein
MLAVADAVSHGPLNIVEQSRAMNLLARCFENRKEAIAAAKAVGLAMNSKLARKLSLVQSFSRQLQEGLIEATIGFPVALRMQEMFIGADLEALSAFFRKLRLSLTRQKEMLDWIETITQRDGVSIQELLSDQQILQWRRDRRLDDPQKSRLIRQYIKKRCYPTISAFEQYYAHALKKIRMGKGIRFSPPPHFEGRSFSLGIDFSSHDECLQKVEDIQQLVQTQAFCDLLEPKFEPDN